MHRILNKMNRSVLLEWHRYTTRLNSYFHFRLRVGETLEFLAGYDINLRRALPSPPELLTSRALLLLNFHANLSRRELARPCFLVMRPYETLQQGLSSMQN